MVTFIHFYVKSYIIKILDFACYTITKWSNNYETIQIGKLFIWIKQKGLQILSKFRYNF